MSGEREVRPYATEAPLTAYVR